ncbi:response regulator, partial [Xanthomonas sp. Kuri4-3]
AAQYAPVAAGRGLRLHVHARPLWVRSDRRLLRRVMQNFIANALRYTRQGRIVLGLRGRGDEVELQVWDTGPGIPEHHMRQIFEEFHRYQQPFDWGEQGLGLGLSICQRISRLLDHGLSARSQVGKGSMFSILLPRVAAVARAAPSPPSRALSSGDSLVGLRVLCVDNDQEILDGMRALLGRWQVEVISASTVDQALERMQARPDVLLVDYHLHDRLDGLDTLEALNARAQRQVPGALLTADGRDELKQLARERGYRLLTKPVKPASLRAFLSAFHDPLRVRESGAGSGES